MGHKLYLIDGSALLYRAHFAFIKNPLINSKRMNISAIYGVINSFLHLLESTQASHLAIAFDRKPPTFRHHIYEAYKANRPPMPDDLIAQIEPVHEFFRLIGLPELGKDGFEADDILGTLANRFQNEAEIVLVTSDKDYCQLVNERTSLLDPMKDIRLDSQAVYHKYGVWPQQFVDYLALVGDSSDNIPGVKSIGAKTAEALLQEYQSLDGIYANLDKIKPRFAEKLKEEKKNAYLSQQLATIDISAPLSVSELSDLQFDPGNLRAALPLLIEHEISSLRRKIEQKYPLQQSPSIANEYQDDIFAEPEKPEPEKLSEQQQTEFEAVLVDKLGFVGLLNEIKRSEMISIDTETDALDPMQANLVGISLCMAGDKAYYLPLGHQLSDNLPLKEVLRHLESALAGKHLLGHNLKYDLCVLGRHGLKLENPIFDTMLAAYVLDPGINSYSLDACALRELNHAMIPITELIGKGKSQISFDLVDTGKACVYAAEDAWAVWQLYPIYRRKIDFSPMANLYDNIELPLIRVLQKMEENGVAIDTSILSDISHLINLELKKLIDAIYQYAGYEFNLNSTQQLAKLLFEEKGLPNRKKTKTGFSTDNSVLEELSEDYEIAAQLIQYRQLSKLQSTYVSALPKMLNPLTNRIHSSFNQTVASTGRLSSTNPNLQNIPVRTELGREIRKAFCARDSQHLIMAADYSQIELRLLALMSRDELLIEAFRNNQDIHKRTAARIYSVALDEVSSDQRRAAKTINFGILYGMGQRKLSRELGISLSEAKAIIESYFAQFPSIRTYINSCIQKAHQEHYCETLFGRRLYLPNITSKNQGLKSEAERVSVNMPIQGSAADIIKIAMLNIHQLINKRDDLRMILQVHDELVFEVHKSTLDEARSLVQGCMENSLPEIWRNVVQLKTDLGTGQNWFEAH